MCVRVRATSPPHAHSTTPTTNHTHKKLKDEPFHVGQTATYCAGRWREWDPKITTLPGLYALGVAYAAAARALLGWAGVDAVRVFLVFGCVPVLLFV